MGSVFWVTSSLLKRFLGTENDGGWPGESRPPWARESLARFGFWFPEPLQEERVRGIGELGDERKVVPTEVVRVAIVQKLVAGRTGFSLFCLG